MSPDPLALARIPNSVADTSQQVQLVLWIIGMTTGCAREKLSLPLHLTCRHFFNGFGGILAHTRHIYHKALNADYDIIDFTAHRHMIGLIAPNDYRKYNTSILYTI